jgi:hypothetical protein
LAVGSPDPANCATGSRGLRRALGYADIDEDPCVRRRKVDDLANASSDAVAAGESFQETYRDRRAPGRQVVLSKAAGAGLVRVEPPRMHESTVRESPVR